MTLLLLGLGAVLLWLAMKGRISTRQLSQAGALVLGLAALRFGIYGSPVLGVALGAGAIAWWMALEEAASRGKAEEARALAMLGLGPEATREDVRAAHRRLSADAHPDRGGTNAEQQALNAARDFLLKRRRPGDA